MNDIGSLQTFVLAVAAAPLGAAAVCGLMSRGDAARRFAVGFSLVHLAMVFGVIYLAANGQGQRTLDAGRFTPFAVPGSPTDAAETTFDLFPVGPSSPGRPAPAVQFYLGLDGFNLPLVALTSL